MLEIITDKKWKSFKTRKQVPKEVLKRQFGQLSSGEDDHFLLYRGRIWLHLSEFKAVGHTDGELKNWDGYFDFSRSTGVLIKVSKDGGQYMVAGYIDHGD